MCSCYNKNAKSIDTTIWETTAVQKSQSYDNKIWEITDIQNSGIIGKWLHPFGDRILEITETQIIEHFFNGDETISMNYKIENEEISFSDNYYIFKIIQDDMMEISLKNMEGKPIYSNTNGYSYEELFNVGFYHRINNIGITGLHEGSYRYTYSFGKWAYRWSTEYINYQAPDYWLRAHNDPYSLEVLHFIDNNKLLIRKIFFFEEDKDINPWGGVVSYTKPEECEYEIIDSDLIIKTDNNILKLKIVNKKTIFYYNEKSLFIYNLDDTWGYIR